MERISKRLGFNFLQAAELGELRIKEFQGYLDAGFPVNYQCPLTGETALHAAASTPSRSAIRTLIKNETCNYLLRDKKGRLASEIAYLYGEDPALARLLGIKERKQAASEGIKLTRRPRPMP